MLVYEYKNNNDSYTLPQESEYLSDLKKLNIFVGANNSGKSRFLRAMMKADAGMYVYKPNLKQLNGILLDVYNGLADNFKHAYAEDLKKLALNRTGDFYQEYNDFLEKLKSIEGRHVGVYNSTPHGMADPNNVGRVLLNKLKELDIYKPFEEGIDLKLKFAYIPILRGLRHVDSKDDYKGKQDLYFDRTIRDYDLPNNDTRIVFSGLSLYTDIKSMLLGSRNNRTLIAEFESFLSVNFFDHYSVTLISDYNSENIKINIGEGEDREIYNVGDGIQSIIIIAYLAFRHKEQKFLFFIEEPELMMHPSIQRVLVEALLTKFENIQVFLTTHSNHFLDLTYDYSEDVAIYSFQPIDGQAEKFKINNVTDNRVVLDLLGVRNSSVFLSNCVIWVEGVTDRMLLRKLLKMQGNFPYKEDYNYTFAEYGGGNLANFDFISIAAEDNSVTVNKISNKNFIIADNDAKTTGGKAARRVELKESLGDEHFFDGYIEIENLIPYVVWKKVVEILLPENTNKKIRKREGYVNCEEKFNKQLSKKKIGKILKDNLIELRDVDEEPDYFKANSVECIGRDKKHVMNIVIKVIDELALTVEDFPEANNVLEKITTFVQKSNKQS